MIVDLLTDILYSITLQKRRTLLTGFGVSWGIFILIILLGASSGLEKGIMQLLNGYAQNSLWVYGGHSTAEIGNNKHTKPVLFNLETIDQLKQNFQGLIKSISPEAEISADVIYEGKSTTTQIRGVLTDYFRIKILKPDRGRIISPGDNVNRNKVIVIGEKVKDKLFGKRPAIGKEVQIGNYFFQVIGVLKGGSVFDQAEQNAVFIPYQTALVSLYPENNFNVIGITCHDVKNIKSAETYIRKFLGRSLMIDADDNATLYIFNFNQQVETFHKIFTGLNIFFWFIGICLLMSGIAGVANIMFVIVNERTSEIGIRKAVGATSQHILWMILLESAFITVLAGIIGVILGTGVLSLLGYILRTMVDDSFIIKDVSINLLTIFGALFVLVFSGIVAGLIPAKRATEIQPIDAIRSE